MQEWTDTLESLLTMRERQIVHLLSEGLSNKEIGRQLNLAEGTIKVHLHNMYEKLAVNNRTMLAALFTSSDIHSALHIGRLGG